MGQIETDVIPFGRNSSTLIFFRMVMGLVFLPDSMIGVDATIIRRELGVSSNEKFCDLFPPFDYKVTKPFIDCLKTPSHQFSNNPPLAITHDAASAGQDSEFCSVVIGSKIYPVVRLLFRTQTLIGRATRTFLVRLPDGRNGVLKDSWITTDRPTEANFLKGLEIPFGPRLVDHCVLGNTSVFRSSPIRMAINQEVQEKRRIVTYPAGVHISDFRSLWELMVAMLDVVVGMINSLFFIWLLSDVGFSFSSFPAILSLESNQKLHRDISYTNILL
jgi:hypothetical protein